VYVHEDKSILDDERLLELTQRLDLTKPRSVQTGENVSIISFVVLVCHLECSSPRLVFLRSLGFLCRSKWVFSQ